MTEIIYAAQAVEKTAQQATTGMTVTLDIAAMIGAIAWPVTILIILLVFRKKIPPLAASLFGRITKLAFAGVTLELAKAKPFTPEWSGPIGALDLRSKASSFQITDSTRRMFQSQLTEPTAADYAVVDLGWGSEWLTSRLFIMAILFAKMKGLRAFVFVETIGNVRKRYLGWSEPGKIRWALARQFPWLETSYSDAYSTIASAQKNTVVVSTTGKLGFSYQLNDPQPNIDLLQEFLLRIQSAQVPPPPEMNDWVRIEELSGTYEHASWMNSQRLEEILGDELHTSSVRWGDLRGKNERDQMLVLIAEPQRYVAITKEDQRFDALIDRQMLLEKVAQSLTREG